MEIVDIKYAGSGFKYQNYTQKDDRLVLTNYIYSKFGNNDDYIEYHIYDENLFLIDSSYEALNYYPITVRSEDNLYSSIDLNPKNDLRDRGFDRGTLNIQYNFFRRLFNSSVNSKYWIKEISTSRTELRLSSQVLSDSAIRSGFENYRVYIQEKNYYPDFYLNFGDNQLIICTNVAYSEDDNGGYLLIKLYEPLPIDFDLKSELWIVDKVAESARYLVDIQIESEPITLTNRLRGANFKISLDKKVGQTTPYYNYSTIFSSTFDGGTDKIRSYYDDKAVDINVDFSQYSNFIHFSSITQRLNNFKYKLQLIESYNAEIAYQQTSTGAATTATVNTLQGYINNLIEKFDVYEYALYYNSASWAWPKTTSTQPYLLAPTTALESVNWFATQSISASYYDNSNPNQLAYSIPQYILDDSNNQPYVTFVQMIGQHFDNVWIYYKDVTNRFEATNDLSTGISGDLVADALKSLGFIIYTNTNLSDNLYYSLFGINENGGLLPPTGSELIKDYVVSSIPTIGANDLQKEIYKRLYHNLPYLVKTKGTRVGIQALINCFGVPEEILTVNEFGGYDRSVKNGISEINNDKITIISQPLEISSSLLDPNSTIQYFSTKNRLNNTELEIGFSPSEKINTHINQTEGYFNIDSLIGDPLDMYRDTYPNLQSFRTNYFSSYTFPHSLYEYMRMIKYYNNSLFKTVKDFVPARADLSTGLIIKPTMLDRSKYARHEPSASLYLISQSIDMVEITGSYGNIISGSTEHSWNIPSQLGYVQYTSSQGVEKVTGEFGGTTIDVVNGLSMSQYDYASLTGSMPILVNRGATYQNISKAVKSHWRLDLDYSSNQTTPINYGLVTASIAQMSINYSASYGNKYNPFAELQDYNYYTQVWSNIRYDGSYTKSKLYSTYSVGDISYGKQAAIDKLKFQYGYLVDIYTASMFFPGRSNAQIKYIIDDNQDVLNLTKTNENIFEVQNIFKSGETTDVSLFQYDERNSYSQKLLSNKPITIYEGGFRYIPILHSLSGSATPYSQSFELENPITETIFIPQGSTLPPDTSGPEFQESNYELSYWCCEIEMGDGTSRYTIRVKVKYLPAGGVTKSMNLRIVSYLSSTGVCDISNPRNINVSLLNGQTETLSTDEIVFVDIPSTGNGSNCSGPFDTISHWPPYSTVNKNCDILIRGISSDVAVGPGTLVPFETKNLFISTSQTCLFYLTASNQIMFNPTMSYQVHSGNEPIYLSESDPVWLTSGLDRVVRPFSLSKGDRISLYNSRSLGWDESNEYIINEVSTTGSNTNIRILASLDRPVNQYSVSASLDIDRMTNSNIKICRYIVWKHVPDETNVILRYNPKDSTIEENGLLFPQYIDPVVRKNSGNTVKSLKAQNLI